MTYEVVLKRVTIIDKADSKKDAENIAIDELTEVWDSTMGNNEIFEITVEELGIKNMSEDSMTKVDIDKRADDITEQIYAGFGSGYGVLFGIPSNCRQAVRTVIKQVLRIVDDCPPFSSVRLYKKYRNDRSLLSTERLYVMEAYWKYTETEKDDALGFKDWLFDYYFKGYGDKK